MTVNLEDRGVWSKDRVCSRAVEHKARVPGVCPWGFWIRTLPRGQGTECFGQEHSDRWPTGSRGGRCLLLEHTSVWLEQEWHRRHERRWDEDTAVRPAMGSLGQGWVSPELEVGGAIGCDGPIISLSRWHSFNSLSNSVSPFGEEQRHQEMPESLELSELCATCVWAFGHTLQLWQIVGVWSIK